MASLFGCQHSDYADRRLEHRLAGAERTLKAWQDSEASRPGKLERDFQYVGKEFQERSQKFDRSIRGAGEYLARDVKRFEARQEDYRHEIWRILWGKPETIEKTAIDMFY